MLNTPRSVISHPSTRLFLQAAAKSKDRALARKALEKTLEAVGLKAVPEPV